MAKLSESLIPAVRQWTPAVLAVAGLSAAGYGGYQLWRLAQGDMSLSGWSALGWLTGGLFLFYVVRCQRVWVRLKDAMQRASGPDHAAPGTGADDETRKTLDRGLREPFVYGLVTLFAVAGVSLFAGQPSLPLLDKVTFVIADGGGVERASPHLLVLFATLLLALLPLAVLITLHARLERQIWWKRTQPPKDANPEDAADKAPLLRYDSVSQGSFYITAGLTAALTALAIWAANVSIAAAKAGKDDAAQAAISQNLAVWITFAVVGAFLVFILMPHIQRLIDNWGDRRPGKEAKEVKAAGPAWGLDVPAKLASAIDSILVRLIAPLTGATQPGRGIPHLFVIFTLLPLTALGFALPPPYGLVPISAGVLMVIALGRRWAWIEEDRETASRLLQTRSREIHVGFENDLKDEALLGYASLFILVPLALYQINAIIPAFTEELGEANNSRFLAWIGFFGAELAKAVPFVDWWEIYGVEMDVAVTPACPAPSPSCPDDGIIAASKHLTFAARAIVDLVIMAALFQAIGIWQRQRTQARLYDNGQLDAFDPFLEVSFFRRGMRWHGAKQQYLPTARFEKRVEKHIENRSKMRLPLTPYNERRLTELLDHPDDEVHAGVQWMVDHYDVLVGPPLKKIEQLSRQWKKAGASQSGGSAPARAQHPAKQAEWRREQKPRIEAVIDELDRSIEPSERLVLSHEHVAFLLALICRCNNFVEFKYARTRIVEVMGRCDDRSPDVFWALALQTRSSDGASAPTLIAASDLVKAAAALAGMEDEPQFRFGNQDDRVLVYRAMKQLADQHVYGDPKLASWLPFLEQRAGYEEGERAKSAAAELLKVVQDYSSREPDPVA